MALALELASGAALQGHPEGDPPVGGSPLWDPEGPIRGPEGPERAELCIVLADEDMVCDLNRRYLGRDGTTDVIAFGQAGGPAPLLGDVVVCVPQARRQARPARNPVEKEICLLAIHGILHLLGWDDQTPADRRKMMRRAHQIWRAAQQES